MEAECTDRYVIVETLCVNSLANKSGRSGTRDGGRRCLQGIFPPQRDSYPTVGVVSDDLFRAKKKIFSLILAGHSCGTPPNILTQTATALNDG